MGIIGMNFQADHLALLVYDEPSWHWQRPIRVTIKSFEIDTEALVDLLQISG